MGDVDLLKKEDKALLATTLQNRAIIIGKKKTEVRFSPKLQVVGILYTCPDTDHSTCYIFCLQFMIFS